MGLALGHVPAGETENLQTQEDLCTIKTFIRRYTVKRLRKSAFNHLADALTDNAEPSLAQKALFQKCFTIAQERKEEFEDILSQLNIDNNLEEIYCGILFETFSDAVNLGRILTFAAFSAELVAHCSLQGREDLAFEVAGWEADLLTQQRLDNWVQRQGGWASLAREIIGNNSSDSHDIAVATTH